MKLTSKERISRVLKHQSVDRIGLFEVFWRETAEKWSAEGHFEKPEMISDHFGLDVRDGNGALLRRKAIEFAAGGAGTGRIQR